jgi:hypothetical protein
MKKIRPLFRVTLSFSRRRENKSHKMKSSYSRVHHDTYLSIINPTFPLKFVGYTLRSVTPVNDDGGINTMQNESHINNKTKAPQNFALE